MASAALAQFPYDLVEVSALDGTVQNLLTAKCRGDRFQQPKDLLDSLAAVAVAKCALRRVKGFVDERLRLDVK